MTSQNAPGSSISRREVILYPSRKRNAPRGVLACPWRGKVLASPARSSNPRPGQLVFLPGEGNPHPHGKTGKKRCRNPPGLCSGCGGGIGSGRSSARSEHLVRVGQGGGVIDSGLARAGVCGIGISPARAGYLIAQGGIMNDHSEKVGSSRMETAPGAF